MAGILRRLMAPAETRKHPSDPGDWSAIFGSGWSTPAGVDVTPESALASSVVFACTRVLAESVASLPLLTYQRSGRGKERAARHPVYRLLHSAPNPEMTSFTWREWTMGYLCRWGNAISEIDWGNDGYPRALWPLPMQQIEGIERTPSGQIRYLFRDTNGQLIYIARRNILHIKFMGTGWWGDSPVRLGLRSLGLELAAEEYGSKWFANGARPGIVLKHPGVLGDKALGNLKASWATEHQGLSNAHRLRVLEEGMDIATIGSPPDEAQFLETRRFQRSAIAGWFRVPLHKIGDLEHATFSNIEHQGIEFVTDSLRPWLVRIEQELESSLLVGAERDELRIEHLVDGLLRGDTVGRYQAYATALQNGFMSPNEIRALENLNPYDGGDTYLLPLNMVPADQAGAPADDAQPDAVRAQGVGGLPLGERTNERANERGEGRRARGEDGDPAPHDVRGWHPPGNGCTCDACRASTAADLLQFAGTVDFGISEVRDEPDADQEALAGQRRRLAGTYVRLFEDGVGRLVRREVADIRRAAEKYLIKAEDVDAWRAWLDEFYADLREVVPEYLAATLTAMAEQVAAGVADEQDGTLDVEDLSEFVDGYLETYAGGYVASHNRQLRALTDEGEVDGVPVAERIAGRLDGWADTEAKRQALGQAYEGVNALTVAAYAAVGVRYLMWVATGESCEFCRAMSGRIVGIDGYFIEDGGSVQGLDGGFMSVSRRKRHGPIHEGCDCVVVAV